MTGVSEATPDRPNQQSVDRIAHMPPRHFDLGAVIKDSFGLLLSQWRVVLTLTICVGVLVPIMWVIAALLVSLYPDFVEPESNGDFLGGQFLVTIGAYCFGWSLHHFLLSWALVSRRLGLPLLPLDTGFRAIPALVSIGVMVGMGIICGLAGFIVTGLWIMARWTLAGPISIAEKLGPISSIKRSAELTNGYAGLIFVGLFSCALLAIGWVVGGITLMNAVISADSSDTYMITVLIYIFLPLGIVFSNAFSVALYFQLVPLKEGGTEKGIADVFD
jgi:hypothetical protein